ncbi:MAG: type II secretion system protein [Candidatus Saccharibacteria bacterium]|nr:type II secretion system protein [Candidatus Saccharibacteria bacterium]
MYKKLNANKDGFTIIEVLIVLAIAGLIMLIVFLAVPALQRNSRNTQRRNDVSAVLGAFSEYTNNNRGELPSSFGDIQPLVELGYYEPSNITISAYSSDTFTADSDTLNIYTGAECGDVSFGSATPRGAVSGPSRSIAATFGIESTGDTVAQCEAS